MSHNTQPLTSERERNSRMDLASARTTNPNHHTTQQPQPPRSPENSQDTAIWRQNLEKRLKRIEDLEKSVSSLRSELIDEVRRRKALEEYVLSKAQEFDNMINSIQVGREKKKKELLTSVRSRDALPLPSGFSQRSLGTIGGGSQLDDCDPETFIEWLIDNKLSEFIPLFTGEEVPPSDQGYLPMFQRIKDRNQIALSKCNIAKLLEFIFLPEDDPLTKLWDRKFFVRDFILTHQAFMKPQQLFKFLQLKCCSTGSTTSIILLTRDFLQSLVKYLKFDLRVNETWFGMISQLANAIGKVNADVSKDITKYLELALTVRPVKATETNATSENVLEAALLNFVKDYDVLTLEHHTYEFAAQLTLTDQKLVQGTETWEFLNQAWTTNKISTPNLDKYLDFTNRVSGFIARDILIQPMSRLQAETITFYIEVAIQLNKLNNFNSIQMVLACLHSPPIAKIKTAWSLVPKRAKEDFERLTELMSPQNHYRAYEEGLTLIDELEAPVIPFVSVTLRDLFLVEEALHSVVKSPHGWVNCDKMSKLGKILWNFRKYQLKYNISPISVIQDYIEDKAEIWDNKVAYEIARLREEYSDADWNVLPRKPVSKYDGEEIDMYNIEILSIAEWQLILGGMKAPQVYRPGTEIIKRGEECNKIFYVEAGELNIDGIAESGGDRFTIGTIGKNQLIGLESLLQHPPLNSPVWIKARGNSEVRLREVDLQHLLNLFKKEHDLFAKFNRILAGRLAQLLKNRRAKIKKGTPNSVHRQNSHTAVLKAKKKSKSTSLTNKLKYKKPIFEDTFELVGEVAIKEYSCQLRKGVSINGLLFVSQNNLCFANYNIALVKLKHRIVVPLNHIVSIQKQGKVLIITCERGENNEKEDLEFSNFDNLEEVTEFLSGFWYRKMVKKDAPDDQYTDTQTEGQETWSLTSTDWDKIMCGSKEITYKNKEIIKASGTVDRVLYRVLEGTCHTYKRQQVINETTKGCMFGVQEFLLNSGRRRSSHEVIASKDQTRICRIEGYFLDVLFSYNPLLCGRFYHHLATELAAKLQTMFNSWMDKEVDVADFIAFIT